MKVTALALLLATTDAKALTTPKPMLCPALAKIQNVTNSNRATSVTFQTTLSSCTTSLMVFTTTSKPTLLGFAGKALNDMSANGQYKVNAMFKSKTITQAQVEEFMVAQNAFAVAAGVGPVSCFQSMYKATMWDATKKCTAAQVATAPKGSWEYQDFITKYASDYFLEMGASCNGAKRAEFATPAACMTAGLKALTAQGTAQAAADVGFMTVAARDTWWKTEMKKLTVAAAGAPLAGKAGFSCKAAAAVAPATVGVRPKCDAANCCMGMKKAAADTTNTGGELCQLKTALKADVYDVYAATSKAGYIMKSKSTATSYTGACIEGAVRTASAAFTVLATVYMMA